MSGKLYKIEINYKIIKITMCETFRYIRSILASVENLGLSKVHSPPPPLFSSSVFFFLLNIIFSILMKPQNLSLHASPAARKCAFPVFASRVHSISFVFYPVPAYSDVTHEQ